MWTRSDLKERAKMSLDRKYWRAVLMAFILAFTTGGFSVNFNVSRKIEGNYIVAGVAYNISIAGPLLVTIGIILLLVLIILACIFILPPLQVGCRRYFLVSRLQDAEVSEIGFGFAYGYGNIVKIQFLRQLYTFLWSLLFLIPGIIKSYEYRMIPYLLAENPNLSCEAAFRISREMMKGQKWDAFVLDLSFLGWIFLSACTCGILAIFYVLPYMAYTDAELYVALQNRPFNGYNTTGNGSFGKNSGADFPYDGNGNWMM